MQRHHYAPRLPVSLLLAIVAAASLSACSASPRDTRLHLDVSALRQAQEGERTGTVFISLEVACQDGRSARRLVDITAQVKPNDNPSFAVDVQVPACGPAVVRVDAWRSPDEAETAGTFSEDYILALSGAVETTLSDAEQELVVPAAKMGEVEATFDSALGAAVLRACALSVERTDSEEPAQRFDYEAGARLRLRPGSYTLTCTFDSGLVLRTSTTVEWGKRTELLFSPGGAPGRSYSFSSKLLAVSPVVPGPTFPANTVSASFDLSTETPVSRLRATMIEVTNEATGLPLPGAAIELSEPDPSAMAWVVTLRGLPGSGRFSIRLRADALSDDDRVPSAEPLALRTRVALATVSFPAQVPMGLVTANGILRFTSDVTTDRTIATITGGATAMIRQSGPGNELGVDVAALEPGQSYTVTLQDIGSVNDEFGTLPVASFQFTTAESFAGRDLYVSAGQPDDSGDGTSPATAKRSIGAALGIAQPSDIIRITIGDYPQGTTPLVVDKRVTLVGGYTAAFDEPGRTALLVPLTSIGDPAQRHTHISGVPAIGLPVISVTSSATLDTLLVTNDGLGQRSKAIEVDSSALGAPVHLLNNLVFGGGSNEDGDASAPTNAAVFVAQAATGVLILNNLVHAGCTSITPSESSLYTGIDVASAAMSLIANNTVVADCTGTQNIGITTRVGANSRITNNLIFAVGPSGTTTSAGIFQLGADEPTSLLNNFMHSQSSDAFGVAAYRRTFPTIGGFNAESTVNGLDGNATSGRFHNNIVSVAPFDTFVQNPTGLDGNRRTLFDNDWRLVPAATPDLRITGINALSPSCGTTLTQACGSLIHDRMGTPWPMGEPPMGLRSIGAYQFPN